MKPLIGITADTFRNLEKPRSLPYYGQKFTYSDAISLAGGVPVIIPITTTLEETRDIHIHLDGVLFAGGNDVSPALYGQETTYAVDLDMPRDAHEMRLMHLAHTTHKPILAICRGMQLLNVYRGGTLFQDIGHQAPAAMNHDGHAISSSERLLHDLRLARRSRLAGMVGEAAIVANSFHHQAVDMLGEGLTISAVASDGIVEAIEDRDAPFIVGVQPHPESLVRNVEPRWLGLFEAFIRACTTADDYQD